MWLLQMTLVALFTCLHLRRSHSLNVPGISPQYHLNQSQPCQYQPKNQGSSDLYFCYNGTINATFIIPASSLGGTRWPHKLNNWKSHPIYIEARKQYSYAPRGWGEVVATTDTSWDKNSYGWDNSQWEKNYTNLILSGDSLSFHLYADQMSPNQGHNCTTHRICAWSSGYDPCWPISFCKTERSTLDSMTTSSTTATSNVKPAPVDTEAQTVLIIPRNQFYTSFGTQSSGDQAHEHNSWFRALQEILKVGGVNESCYVCTLMPHTLSQSVLVRPHPYSVKDVQCILFGILNENNVTKSKLANRKVDDVFTPWYTTNTSRAKGNCSAFNGIPLRKNYTLSRLEGLYRPVMTIIANQIPEQFPICFTRHNNRTDNIAVGKTSNCSITINATCGTVWNITTCNITGRGHRIKLNNETVYGPSDDGAVLSTNAVWLCGDTIWQQLPPHWSGTCAIVYLTPTLQLYDKLKYTTHHYPHYRPKRDTHVEMTSDGTKFGSGLFPWWGTVNNAHNIDKLHVQLENLTAIVSDGFSALTPWAASVRNTLVQYRLALDIILASQGGLCHVIGEQCCTYIPDISGNLSTTVEHLNNLLADMKKDDISSDDDWSFWDWLSFGNWKGKLLSLVTPIIAILIMICVFTACIIPCIRSCITRLVAVQVHAALTRYEPLPHNDTPGGVDSSTDSEESEAEDSI